MAADPSAVKDVVEGLFGLFALLGVIPSTIVAPIVLIGGGVAALFDKKKGGDSDESI